VDSLGEGDLRVPLGVETIICNAFACIDWCIDGILVPHPIHPLYFAGLCCVLLS